MKTPQITFPVTCSDAMELQLLGITTKGNAPMFSITSSPERGVIGEQPLPYWYSVMDRIEVESNLLASNSTNLALIH